MLAIEIKTTKLTSFLVKQLPPATDEDLDAFLDSGGHGVHVRLGMDDGDVMGVYQGAGRMVRSRMVSLAPEGGRPRVLTWRSESRRFKTAGDAAKWLECYNEMKERCATQVYLES